MKIRCCSKLNSPYYLPVLIFLSVSSFLYGGLNFISPADYKGSDSQRIQQAVDEAAKSGKRVLIPRQNEAAKSEIWLLDEAILLPSNVTVELDGCLLKLSDSSRDNFFRSANCGAGITEIKPLENIHIIGRSGATLQGADRPRATGDGAKTLGERSYGTDAKDPAQEQKGDWRNIGILFSRVSNFSIKNLHMIDSHCWAISIEYGAHGVLRDLSFDSTGKKIIDGKEVTILNQDGVDLRRGCHDIIIENISGRTGDDLVALTAILSEKCSKGGSLTSTMVSGDEETNYPGIHNVIIRNVLGYCAGGHNIVRLLNTSGLPMENIIIDGVIDTSPPHILDKAAIRIGDTNPAYGKFNKLGDTRHILVNNVLSRSESAVFIGSALQDSSISNVIHQTDKDKEEHPAIIYKVEKELLKNITIQNVN